MTKTVDLHPTADDFASFFLSDTSALDIELPNGEPMLYNGQQVRVHLYGPSTTQHAKAKEALDREAIKRVVAASGAKGKREAEDKDADVRFLVAVTARVENFPFPGGAEGIYREKRLAYIADQVRKHLGDMGNFFSAGEAS
jgi:hypothetical protein